MTRDEFVIAFPIGKIVKEKRGGRLCKIVAHNGDVASYLISFNNGDTWTSPALSEMTILGSALKQYWISTEPATAVVDLVLY